MNDVRWCFPKDRAGSQEYILKSGCSGKKIECAKQGYVYNFLVAMHD